MLVIAVSPDVDGLFLNGFLAWTRGIGVRLKAARHEHGGGEGGKRAAIRAYSRHSRASSSPASTEFPPGMSEGPFSSCQRECSSRICRALRIISVWSAFV